MNKAGAVMLGREGFAPPEPTLDRVEHPEHMQGGTLINDPSADRLCGGDPALGWEGDNRLALYLDQSLRKWMLWRLEHDGVYRLAHSLPCDGRRGIDAVGGLVLWLVTHDGRRGYQVMDVVASDQAHAASVRARHNSDQNYEVSERMAHALMSDGMVARDFFPMHGLKGRS